jgi:hypothetical protein
MVLGRNRLRYLGFIVASLCVHCQRVALIVLLLRNLHNGDCYVVLHAILLTILDIDGAGGLATSLS